MVSWTWVEESCQSINKEIGAVPAQDRRTPPRSAPAKKQNAHGATPKLSLTDDDFGDFSTQGNDVFEDVDFGEFAGQKSNGMSLKPMEQSLMDMNDLPLPSRPGTNRTTGFFAFTPTPAKVNGSSFYPTTTSPGSFYLAYKRHHLSLVPLCRHIRSSPSPSSTLSLLFPPSSTTSLPPTLSQQSDLLLSLLTFLSPQLQPLHDWGFLRQALLAATDRFDSTCLVAFEIADSKDDEQGMSRAAESSWKVWEAGGGGRDQWECGRVWVEKREVFYEKGKWDPAENMVYVRSGQILSKHLTEGNRKVQTNGVTIQQLDFTPMDAFMSHVLEAFRADADRAVRVFPTNSRVVLAFCDRLANDVVRERSHQSVSVDDA